MPATTYRRARARSPSASTAPSAIDRRRRLRPTLASSAHDEFAAGTTYTDTFAVASADGTLTSIDRQHRRHRRSPRIRFRPSPASPTPVTFVENTVNATPQIIDGDVSFTDPDNNFDGGTLIVTGLLAEDTVAIRNQGNGAGQIGFSGGNVTYGGTVIGSAPAAPARRFTVTFNARRRRRRSRR